MTKLSEREREHLRRLFQHIKPSWEGCLDTSDEDCTICKEANLWMNREGPHEPTPKGRIV